MPLEQSKCKSGYLLLTLRLIWKIIVGLRTRALVKLQKNNHYNSSSSEDTMNDYVRDILDESYELRDQTRQGESESGSDAGEIDIQICVEGLQLVMMEALKLESVVDKMLNMHNWFCCATGQK